MRRQLSRILALLLPLVLLTGCWQQDAVLEEDEQSELLPSEDQQPEEDTGNSLPERFALPYGPDRTLDPITCPDGMQQVVASLLCEGLFRLGPDFEPEPWLCADWSYDAATLTYTLALRPGIVFSDGSALSSADVKTALERARTSVRYGSRFTRVTDITAGEGFVTITLSAPDTGFLSLLDIPIAKADTEADVLIGTGPYFLSREDSGDWLVANQTWWQGDHQPVDRILLVEAADHDTMLYRFTSRDVQLITADLIGSQLISTTGSIRYQDANTTVLHFIGCNTTLPPLNSAVFRQTLSRGIDRSHIVNALLSGHAAAAQLPVSPLSPLYPESLEQRYFQDAFSTAVKELNYEAERTLSLLVNEENSFKVSVAQYLAAQFTAAGIPVAVQALPWAEYTAALAAGQFDLYYGEVKLSANWDLTALLSTGGSLNYGGWSSLQTDRLLADYAAAEDRSLAMTQLCTHLQTAAPVLPICFESSSVLMQNDVIFGLSPTATEPFYGLESCTIRLKTS